MPDLEAAYSPERFRQQGHAVIDMLADCLEKSLSDEDQPVVEMTAPDAAYQEIEALFNHCRESGIQDPVEIFKHIYRRTIRLHNPRYMGHQISPPLPAAALASLMSDLMNNGMGVYEMGIGGTVMERFVIKSMARKFGFGDSADGYLSSGGTLGNLTALVAARRAIASQDGGYSMSGGRFVRKKDGQDHGARDQIERSGCSERRRYKSSEVMDR